MPYLLLFVSVLLTAYGQIVLKWQIGTPGGLGQSGLGLQAIARFVLNPWIWTIAIAVAFLLLSWVIVLRKLELSFAYPVYGGSTFALVLILSALFFREPLTLQKIVSTGLIVAGLIVGSQK
jgi:multidrug transporter EmrE-like cation transporter